ncbi:MAG: hypothetical protein JW966_02790 [Anaerolineae bacterium]|nr:hypothetical protein [Anaerolineae bacterium]
MRRLRPLRRRTRRRERDTQTPLDDNLFYEGVPNLDSDLVSDSDAAFADSYAGEIGEQDLVPFVPVSAPREYDDSPPDTRRRVRFPRVSIPRPRLQVPRLPRRPRLLAVDVQPALGLLAVILVAAGIVGTLLKQDRLNDVPDQIEDWWPVFVVAVAVLWMLAALVRRRPDAVLGSAMLAGVGLSLLLSAQDIATFEETLVGVVLVTIGLGIVIRGFVLRQHTPIR